MLHPMIHTSSSARGESTMRRRIACLASTVLLLGGCQSPISPSNDVPITGGDPGSSVIVTFSGGSFVAFAASGGCLQWLGRGYCTDYVRQQVAVGPPPAGASGARWRGGTTRGRFSAGLSRSSVLSRSCESATPTTRSATQASCAQWTQLRLSSRSGTTDQVGSTRRVRSPTNSAPS